MTYDDRNVAVVHEIVLPIEDRYALDDAHDRFDVDAIAEKVLAPAERGHVLIVDQEQFWAVVVAHAL